LDDAALVLKLSIVIPAHNEAGSIQPVLRALDAALTSAAIPYEIVVVDDHSSDGTEAAVHATAIGPHVRCIKNLNSGGFGLAVRAGLDAFTGDVVAIVMADGSDPPEDLVSCYREFAKGFDCVFGSRFLPASRVVDYPRFKLTINRLANLFIKLLFRIPLNDTTNAFKCYRREVIEGLRPILSNHFNLTVELPLKAIVRGFSYSVIPIGWRNRTEGVSKLKLKEMGSRYLFIVLYVWLEKHLAKGDYKRRLSN
jgi:dolichol-phosphate mannosyltransferase